MGPLGQIEDQIFHIPHRCLTPIMTAACLQAQAAEAQAAAATAMSEMAERSAAGIRLFKQVSGDMRMLWGEWGGCAQLRACVVIGAQAQSLHAHTSTRPPLLPHFQTGPDGQRRVGRHCPAAAPCAVRMHHRPSPQQHL